MSRSRLDSDEGEESIVALLFGISVYLEATEVATAISCL